MRLPFSERKPIADRPLKLDQMGNDLFSDDDIYDMFTSMVNTQIEQVLSNPPVDREPTAKFTTADQEELAQLVQEQMKRAIEARKQKLKQQRESGIYTLLSRESLEAYRRINSAIVTISALGAGFTFTVIFSDIAEPRANVLKDHVRTSWAGGLVVICACDSLGKSCGCF